MGIIYKAYIGKNKFQSAFSQKQEKTSTYLVFFHSLSVMKLVKVHNEVHDEIGSL